MLAHAIHRFFDEQGFFGVNTPIITASDAEGAGALFRVSTLDLGNLPRTPRSWGNFDVLRATRGALIKTRRSACFPPLERILRRAREWLLRGRSSHRPSKANPCTPSW
jgi:hypothetical protein